MSYLYRPKSVKWQIGGKIVPRGTPGAKKKTYQSKYWYGSFRDYLGEEVRKKLSTNKAEAQRLLAQLITEDDRRRLGFHDPAAEARAKPLAEHLDDYRDYLEAKGGTPRHVRHTLGMVRTVLVDIGAVRIEDITEASVMSFLRDLRQARELPPLPPDQSYFTRKELSYYAGVSLHTVARNLRRHGLTGKGNGRARRYPRAAVERLRAMREKGRGVGTANHYAAAVRAFTRWLWRNHRVERDPLSMLSRFNPATDVRRKRRALSPEEFAALLSATQKGKRVKGLSGPDRARLYLLAARSGFRVQELASLVPGSFDLKGGFVILPAVISKRRRAEKQPIGQDILTALTELIRSTKPGQPLWPGTWHERAADMLRVDLAAAGIAFETAEGVFDFHAIRHLFISDLIASGVNPKEAQILARHSTIELTLGRYSHVQAEKLREVVEKLGK